MSDQISIIDCLARELMIISRPGNGGDIEIAVYDAYHKDDLLYTNWFQLEKPYKQNYEKILVYFNEIKKLLIQRDPDTPNQ